ncbi:MAG: HNH/ENDO VII family nuclease [Lentisphaeraceae bacterium]|nr:HNH/ENDO VII family nuclease [Lentisphaeraceae bacterium]
MFTLDKGGNWIGRHQAHDGRVYRIGNLDDGTGLVRPSLYTSTKKQIRDATARNRYGQFEDEFGIIDDIHYGHRTGFENRRLIAAAEQLGLDQSQLNKFVNANPQHFQIERASTNLSHANEMIGKDRLGPILREMKIFFGL